MIKIPYKQKYEGKKGLWWWIATWFSCGLSPVTSGTVGTLGALPFAWFIQTYYGNAVLFAASIIIFLIGIWASNEYLRITECKHDPSEIVVDEVAGVWLLLAFMPLSIKSYILGFILFRIFDIIKPWPVSMADRKVHGGLGVMLDDMLAGAYPIILFLIVHALWPEQTGAWMEMLHVQ